MDEDRLRAAKDEVVQAAIDWYVDSLARVKERPFSEVENKLRAAIFMYRKKCSISTGQFHIPVRDSGSEPPVEGSK